MRSSGTAWLLLIHQLPAKPAYARVKVWRRLQALGAVTVKGAVYALPANGETREDFAWLAKEIVESGGEAIVCEAALVDGLSDRELQALFDAARDEDYQRIAAEAREVAAVSVMTCPTTHWPRSPARRRGCANNSMPSSPSTSSAPMRANRRRVWCRASRPACNRRTRPWQNERTPDLARRPRQPD